MSQSDLDQTLDLLSADDAATRRNAAKRLGDLKRPEAIPRLVSVYNNDEDESVRRAAADALRVFRAMEQATPGRDNSAAPAAGPGALGRIRLVLALALALTIFINVALVVSRLLPPPAPAVPQQSTPTPRDDLVKAYAARINDVRRDTTALRAVFTGLQGLGIEALKLNKGQCDQLKTSTVNTVEMGNLDSLNYPDLRDVNDAINEAAGNDFTMRNTLNTICSLTSADDLNNQLKQLGGAAALVGKVDNITNHDLANASTLLKKAIDNPLPTITPTFTPSNTFTPTITDTPTITNTPTPLPPTNTPLATNTSVGPTSTPTVAVSPTVTPNPTTTFKGFKLDALKSYVIKNATTIDVKLTGTKTGHASATVIVNRQTSPLTGSYDVTIANSGVPAAALMRVFGAYGTVGASNYTFIDGVMYQTGAIAKLARPATTCPQVRIPDDTGLLKVFANPSSNDLSLTAVGDEAINSVNTRHYHGEETNANVVHDIDLWVSTDSSQQPIRLIDKAVTTATKDNPIGSSVSQETVVSQYDITGIDQPVNVAEPLACNK